MQQQDASLAFSREFPSSQLRRSLFLSREHLRMKVEADSSIGNVHSMRLRRLIFGRETLEPFKLQAGLRIPLRPKELKIRLTPTVIEHSSRPQDGPQFSHSLRLFTGASEGYSRRLRVTNRSDAMLRMRVLTLHDPTSLNFRRERDPPGEIGVNAFNRGDHVVMDDVGDTTGVRVVGFSPRPSAIYMTKDRQRALDVLASGELPDSTAGMSGAILIVTQHDLDLAPGTSLDLAIAALYHASTLEVALADFTALLPSSMARDAQLSDEAGPVFRCSSQSVNFSYNWAKAALGAVEGTGDFCDRIASGFGLQVTRPSAFIQQHESTRQVQRKDGLIPYSGSAANGGVLETALFLIHASSYLQLAGDKKLAKKWYPPMKKAGEAIRRLTRATPSGLVVSEPFAPEGWRRALGAGYPTGITSELNLMVIRALRDLASIAFMVGKGSDAASFRELNVRMLGSLNERLKDAESGTLALNLDAKGRLHKEATIDQAIALSYYPGDHNLSSSIVQRLLEKDFESGYGPRSIPSSNALYYSPTYGDGQLGGCWTRGTLAHAILAYLSGYPSIGMLQVEKVARLVHTDCEKMGGVPGEFPFWLDPDKRTIGSLGSDPVAASRFIESIFLGELGMTFPPQGVKLKVPENSQLRWLFLHGMEVGELWSLFVGRTSGRVFSVSTFRRLDPEASLRFQYCEKVETPTTSGGSVEALLFWTSSPMVLCVGNTSAGAPYGGNLTLAIRGKPLANTLFADLEELNPATSTWDRTGRVKLLDRLELRVEVKPGAWKVLRLAPVGPK